MRRAWMWLLPMACVACNADLPELEYEGDRIRVGSEQPVCAGTLTYLDAELDRIEDALHLPRDPGPFDLYIVDQETLDRQCRSLAGWSGCARDRKAYVVAERFDSTAIHELVHARMSQTSAAESIALFEEGVAVALESETKCGIPPDWDPPTAAELLPFDRGEDMHAGGYFIGGALVRWLIDSFGAYAVLAFMTELDDRAKLDEIRASYTDHFGRAIDDDLYSHWDELDSETDPTRLGCVAPELPRADGTNRRALRGELDCAAANVQNDFDRPGWGYIEWTLTVAPEQSNSLLHLLGEVPPGTELTFERCACVDQTPLWPFGEPDPSFAVETGEVIEAGHYRVRWSGPLDAGAEIDAQLDMPCSYAEQDCGPGLKCSSSGACEPMIAEPHGELEPCEQIYAEPSQCGPKLTCVGEFEYEGVTGVCMRECESDDECGEGHVCEGSVCTTTCNVDAPDCPAPLICRGEPDGSFCEGFGATGPGEPCLGDSYCAPELACVEIPDDEGCQAGWLLTGCCSLPCTSDADCPGGQPTCTEVAEGYSVCTE